MKFMNMFMLGLHCSQLTEGDIAKRLCTAEEVKFFLNSLLGKSVSANYLKPNKNCNLTSWVPGCEPGWACSVPSSKMVDLKNLKEIPARTSNCQVVMPGIENSDIGLMNIGKESSWTKRPVEVDSPKPVSQWDQIAECPDSTCAQVVHSNAEICGIVPLAAKECPEQKEQLGKGKVP
ncbi:hypothetical protein JHK87_035731 [Glycine soja]|nr:hypothetical protein JHK87_035731 [Glycine soja]